MPDQPLNNRIAGGRFRVNPAPAASTNDDERDLNVDASGNLLIGGSPSGSLPVSVTPSGGTVSVTEGTVPWLTDGITDNQFLYAILVELRKHTVLLSSLAGFEVSETDVAEEFFR